MRLLGTVLIALLAAACGASTQNISTIILPTSNKSIDVVQHRSDVKFLDCGTLVVLQTYDTEGKLIDSKDARGQALHCSVLPAMIEAGGRVGAAYATPAQQVNTTISNVANNAANSTAGATSASNSASASTSAAAAAARASQRQGQGQVQGQIQGQAQGQINAPTTTNNNNAQGGQGGTGGAGDPPPSPSSGNSNGNNGNGNGSGDGTNPGTSHSNTHDKD